MFGDFADRHNLELGQGVLRADHQHQLISENWLDLQAGRLDRQRQNADFHGAVLELLDNLVTEIAIDTNLHWRISPAVLAEDLGQDVETCRFISSNSQGSARSTAVIGHCGERFVAQSFQSLGVFVEDLPGGSQLDRLAGAVEQTVPILLLQLTNLGADRRLRSKNLLART